MFIGVSNVNHLLANMYGQLSSVHAFLSPQHNGLVDLSLFYRNI